MEKKQVKGKCLGPVLMDLVTQSQKKNSLHLKACLTSSQLYSGPIKGITLPKNHSSRYHNYKCHFQKVTLVDPFSSY